jgi:hypothetical protein
LSKVRVEVVINKVEILQLRSSPEAMGRLERGVEAIRPVYLPFKLEE